MFVMVAMCQLLLLGTFLTLRTSLGSLMLVFASDEEPFLKIHDDLKHIYTTLLRERYFIFLAIAYQ